MEQQKTPIQNIPGKILKDPNLKNKILLVAGAFFIVVLGVEVGWLISKKITGTSAPITAKGIKVTANEAGIIGSDFKGDTATGQLVEGGVSGEGTYHLERDGGPTKNVYLTSSVVDLSIFSGKKVEVWGDTLAAKKAGWLMDVVKIKVVE